MALTSLVMKSLERLVLKHIRALVELSLDPLQFAYQSRIEVEDAIIFLLYRAYTHQEEAGSSVSVMFFDFSSAFNTIRHALPGTKLLDMQVDAPLVAWITNYLTGRPQYVRLQSNMSDTIVSNMGAPQGRVPSPLLFTLHLRLQILLTVLPTAEVFGLRCHCGLYQQGTGVRVQECGGQFCGVAWTESPAAQHCKD